MTSPLIPLLVSLCFGIFIGAGLVLKYRPTQNGGYQPKETGLSSTPPKTR